MNEKEIVLDTSLLRRLEVIDNTGRALVKYLKESETFEFSFQDQGRTLKIFVK